VTDFGYFANFGREQSFEQSNWNFGTANIFFFLLFYLYFLSRLFISSGCGMVGKICGEKKKLSFNCQVLVRVATHPPQFSPPWLCVARNFHTKICFCYGFILLRKLEIIQFPSNFDHQIPQESQRQPHGSLGFISRSIFPLLPSTPEFLFQPGSAWLKICPSDDFELKPHIIYCKSWTTTLSIT
jgi:hypothetical protein